MKKLILFLLLPLWTVAQTSSGMEQEFDYGIKNNSTQTITTPPYLTTTGIDGTQGKIPASLIEKTNNKQNSLAVDGTGTKYPTVDATNIELNSKLSSKGVYGVENLTRIRTKSKIVTNLLGDSVTAGTAATANYGYAAQLNEGMSILQGKLNYKFLALTNFTSTWDVLYSGIGNLLISSNNSSLPIQVFLNISEIPITNYSASVVYSKRPDGGSFEVREHATNNLLATISSNGASEDGIKSPEYTFSAGNSIKIVPLSSNKAYITAIAMKTYPAESMYKVNNFAKGGMLAKGYSDSDIVKTVSFDNPDLVVYALLANDFSGGDLVAFKQKTTLAVNTAKANGSDVLIIVTCGNSGSESTAFRANWVSWLKSFAISSKSALIDFDEIFGGYTLAFSNGLIADSVHPTDAGHLLMANTVNEVILLTKNPYITGKRIDISDTRLPNYSSIKENIYRKTWAKDQYFETPYKASQDNNGNKAYSNMPYIYAPTGSPSQFPKYAVRGQHASFGNNLYINTTDWGVSKNVLATWVLSNKDALDLKENLSNKVTTLVSPNNNNYPTTQLLKDQLDLKVNLASPTFTGTPTAPTAAVGTNTTQIATTAFVQANSMNIPHLRFNNTDKTIWNNGKGGVASNLSYGEGALSTLTTGTNSLAIGYQALVKATTGKANLAFGNFTLNNLIGGSNNTGIGTSALSGIIDGGYNVALGGGAGRFYGSSGSNDNTSSTNSLFLGGDTRASSSTVDNEIVIGSSALGSGSNTATIGNSSIVKTVLRGVVNYSTPYTVATLPAGTQGDTAYVTDALAPTYMTTVVGGGAVVTPVFYDGSAWVAH